jgi:hypothetical protein
MHAISTVTITDQSVLQCKPVMLSTVPPLQNYLKCTWGFTTFYYVRKDMEGILTSLYQRVQSPFIVKTVIGTFIFPNSTGGTDKSLVLTRKQ